MMTDIKYSENYFEAIPPTRLEAFQQAETRLQAGVLPDLVSPNNLVDPCENAFLQGSVLGYENGLSHTSERMLAVLLMTAILIYLISLTLVWVKYVKVKQAIWQPLVVSILGLISLIWLTYNYFEQKGIVEKGDYFRKQGQVYKSKDYGTGGVFALLIQFAVLIWAIIYGVYLEYPPLDEKKK